ncbi:aminoacyl-tRNA hydrolase [Snodgrassella communis]|jgi:peptidyl-tRNA hydrolase, PTH1 family|uniref:Peptidyl-tRNA hydrolase n=1 Tax=Snodgrassella communis TaxID=2946699 RepID=A0A836Z3H5_9NEIS|nr:aminoacyl-tRNA hydrolase [Snodgrassella communis]KDN15127.1 Peptidyl-tRNA hydrolase [Snodgrassella communis]PIT10238.1 aminoacyl-tRNA hydrolase [Snodgrassella communis]PIT26754.1 aminoacyl-tRNA hydrolase [Snodgrassella communis]PIT29828.1 aminoacyl-tRNA hydrolase [Snodgrassella communis]PIT34254.1 aminoacyl-tRNA hydrolase [Snodgrassella communis]
MSHLRLIVGLGNPGSEYEHTRHNIGFDFIDELAKLWKTSLKEEKKFFGQVARVNLNEGEVWLLKPLTFMNKSGTAVQALAKFYKILPEEILIIHDELDIPCGHVRFKKGGSNGGHNGLKDIQAWLGTAEFYRLRLGIGHPGDRNLVIHYVLHKPQAQEQSLITEAMQKSLAAIPQMLTGEYSSVQQQLHSK